MDYPSSCRAALCRWSLWKAQDSRNFGHIEADLSRVTIDGVAHTEAESLRSVTRSFIKY